MSPIPPMCTHERPATALKHTSIVRSSSVIAAAWGVPWPARPLLALLCPPLSSRSPPPPSLPFPSPYCTHPSVADARSRVH
eukprot:365974-Chlamydomonas_euryale.AAC.16